MTFQRMSADQARAPQRLSRWVAAGAAMAAAVLATGVQPARGQSFDSAIATAVGNNCANLGTTTGALNTFCTGGGGAGSASGGGTTASETPASPEDSQRKIKKRLEDKRAGTDVTSGMSAGDTTFGLGALSGYVSLDYQNVDKDTTSLTTGFNSDKFGGTVGADTTFGTTVVGAAFNYGHTRAEFDSKAGDLETDAYGAIVYGSLLVFDNLFIDGVAGYTRKEASLDRNGTLSMPGSLAVGTATSNPNADEYTFGISSGYDFTYQNFTFGPRLGVNYTLTDIGAFTESGSSGIEMAFEKQSFDSLTTSVGARASMAISTSFGVLVPQVSAD